LCDEGLCLLILLNLLILIDLTNLNTFIAAVSFILDPSVNRNMYFQKLLKYGSQYLFKIFMINVYLCMHVCVIIQERFLKFIIA
jgi:hypothetical protein